MSTSSANVSKPVKRNQNNQTRSSVQISLHHSLTCFSIERACMKEETNHVSLQPTKVVRTSWRVRGGRQPRASASIYLNISIGATKSCKYCAMWHSALDHANEDAKVTALSQLRSQDGRHVPSVCVVEMAALCVRAVVAVDHRGTAVLHSRCLDCLVVFS